MTLGLYIKILSLVTLIAISNLIAAKDAYSALKPSSVDKILAVYKLELDEIKKLQGPLETHIQIKEIRLCYGVGKLSNDTKVLGHGLAKVESLLAEHPHDSELKILWAAIKGQYELLNSPLGALAAIPKIEKTLIEVAKNDPKFGNAAAYRGLARLYQLAPSIISVGSEEKALKNYELALNLAPYDLANRLFYAGFLLERREDIKARELVKNIEGDDIAAESPFDFPELMDILSDLNETKK